MRPRFKTMVDLLYRRAETAPDSVGLRFCSDATGGDQQLTYAELHQQALMVGSELADQGRAGERVILLFPPGLEYIGALFGCIYANAIAVPVSPPSPVRLESTLERLRGIINDCAPRLILSISPIRAMSGQVFSMAPELKKLDWLCLDELDGTVPVGWSPEVPDPSTLVMLQYTSGSTSDPKGVMIDHYNIMYNSELIYRAVGMDDQGAVVSWLPFHHDMGLIGGIIQPLYAGVPMWLLSPVDFIKRPRIWLEVLCRSGASHSVGPNFAYDLVARKVQPDQREGLDLSNWKCTVVAAEPVRAGTLQHFSGEFTSCGFRHQTFYPSYGMAEATLLVSGGKPPGEIPSVLSLQAADLEQDCVRLEGSGRQVHLVGLGSSLEGQEIIIVHPQTREILSEREVGEIWIAGPSMARGYWGKSDEENAALFRAKPSHGGNPGGYFMTGDLGFLHEGQLYVTGRIKDLVIVAGRNHYPQDIERTVEKAHSCIRPGCSAAFSVDDGGSERLVVVAEVKRRYHDERRHAGQGAADQDLRSGQGRKVEIETDFGTEPLPFAGSEVTAAIQQAVFKNHEINIHSLVLIKAGTIPKTSSGKIRRHQCRDQFVAGSLEPIFTPEKDQNE